MSDATHPDDIEPRPRRCEECVSCEAQREHVSAGTPSLDDVPKLETRDQLLTYPELTNTAEAHIADLDGLLARYEFDEYVQCSLKGGHPHGLGVVVRTLCGLRLCMGTDCGLKCIIGFDQILADLKRRVGYRSDLRLLESWPALFAARIEKLRRAVRMSQDVVDTMKRHLPRLYAEMRRRAALGAKGEEVMIIGPRKRDLPEELRGHEDARHQLKGLGLFRGWPPIEKLESSWAEFRQQRSLAPDPMSAESAEALKQLSVAADRQAQRVQRWLDDASPFVAERNLSLALIALGEANSRVFPEQGMLRVSYMGESAPLRPVVVR